MLMAANKANFKEKSMLMKVFIVLMMVGIVFSLGNAFYYLLKNRTSGTDMVKALSYRVGISLALFLILLLAFALGLIKPHGI